MFMEFKNADDAAYAMAAMNGHPFDAKHTFWVNRFTDVEKFANLDETWVEPEPEPYVPKVHSSHTSRVAFGGLNNLCRNIFELGWAICKVAISTPPTERKTWRYTGMESPRNAKSLMNVMYVLYPSH